MKITANKPVVIVGGGLAGLTAANYLRRKKVPVILYEAGNKIAGLAQSFQEADGFTYDFGAHFVTNRLAEKIGVLDKCRTVRHYAETVWLGGRSYSHPFGLMGVPRMTASGIAAKVKSLAGNGHMETAADWFRATYGAALANEVAIPLTEAWSGAKAEDLSPAVGDGISNGVARTLWLKFASRMTNRAVSCGYSRELPEKASVYHVYPEGGIGALCGKLAEGLEDIIKLETQVEAILTEDDKIVGVRAQGIIQEASAVISTAPVHVLGKIIEGSNRLDHLKQFRYRPMIFVNLRLKGRGLLPDVVTWTPESQFPFFRLTETPLSMPWLAPTGKTLITVDIGCEKGDQFWQMDDELLGELCIDNLKVIIPDARERYEGCRVLRTPIAYPVFLREYETSRRNFADGTGIENLYSIGRNGEFSHNFMEDVHHRAESKMRVMLSSSTVSKEAVETAALPSLPSETQVPQEAVVLPNASNPAAAPSFEPAFSVDQSSNVSDSAKEPSKEAKRLVQTILIWILIALVISKIWLLLTAGIYFVQHSAFPHGYRLFGAAAFSTIAMVGFFFLYHNRLRKKISNRIIQVTADRERKQLGDRKLRKTEGQINNP